MKKAALLFVFSIFSLILCSQNTSYLVTSRESKSAENIYELLNKKKFTYGFDSITVRQQYPNAKNPDLLLYHVVKIYGGTASVKGVDFLSSTRMFELIEEEELISISECPNPISPVNDAMIFNNLINNNALELLNAECAWSITLGSSNIVVGVADTDFDTTHVDLKNQIIHLSGPVSAGNHHGTMVASCVSAETNNHEGIAAIGYKTKIAACRIPHNGSTASSFDIAYAIWTLYQMGIPIINVSWTGTGLKSSEIREITEGGTLLVVSAGNTETSVNHSSIADIPGVINVSGVDYTNNHGPTGLAHNQWVDVCVMAKDVAVCTTNNSYRTAFGNSVAVPQIAGVAALMLAMNPFLTPAEIENIIKETTVPITDAHVYPGLLGTGRVDAYAAVLRTRQLSYDLYTKDSEADAGVEPYYNPQYGYNSPDIWVRRNRDGGTEHQVINKGSYGYVYVRVRNRGSLPSWGNDKLYLYRRPIRISSVWPASWAPVDSLIIPAIPPGGSDTLCFRIGFPNVPFPPTAEYSLLTRIVSDTDPMVFPEISNTTANILNNNNISIKNVSLALIADVYGNEPGVMAASFGVDNLQPESRNCYFKLHLPNNEEGKPIYEEAEVYVELDEALLQAWQNGNGGYANLQRINRHTFLVKGDNAYLTGMHLPKNFEGLFTVKINFLTTEYTDKMKYAYYIHQYDAATDSLTGGITLVVDKTARPLFEANAGENIEVGKHAIATLSAESIGEAATYNWYDASGNLLYTGTDVSVAVEAPTTYRLEVIASADGFKDYSEVTVSLIPPGLHTLTPNPATNSITVNYHLGEAASAYLRVVRCYGNTNSTSIVNNYLLDANTSQTTLNISDYPQGIYTVTLLCNGTVFDAKNFIKQ